MKKTETDAKNKASKPAGTMTTGSNVKTEVEPKPVDHKQESVSSEAKRIEEKAKQSDAYEYDDADRAKQVYAKLPEGEFSIKEGDVTVIQKL